MSDRATVRVSPLRLVAGVAWQLVYPFVWLTKWIVVFWVGAMLAFVILGWPGLLAYYQRWDGAWGFLALIGWWLLLAGILRAVSYIETVEARW